MPPKAHIIGTHNESCQPPPPNNRDQTPPKSLAASNVFWLLTYLRQNLRGENLCLALGLFPSLWEFAVHERVNGLNVPILYHGRPSWALCRTSFAFHPCASVTALCGHRAASIVTAVMDRVKKEGKYF